MSAATISSLALLKTRFDSGRVDFIDTLRPFVSYLVVKSGQKSLSANDVQRGLQAEFGLVIPRHTVDLILGRLVKSEQLSRESGQYFPKKLENNVEEFERLRGEALRHQNAAIAALRDYAATKLSTELSESEAEGALYEYVDQYSIDCIKAYSNGSVVPVHGKSTKHWQFVVSSFVNEISTKDPDRFKYLVTVVMGRMLSNALLGEDLGAINMKFRETTVYLDSRIVLQILGVLGENSKRLAEEMLKLLRQSDAKLAVFEHVQNEVDAILRKAEHFLGQASGGRGDVLVNFREVGYTQSDAALVRAGIPDRLRDEGIDLVPTPNYVDSLQIDEIALEGEMEAVNLLYQADTAKFCDINSIRSIYVLRKGRAPNRVEDSRAVFVTTNGKLARAAYTYGRRHEESKALSTTITDFSLTNLIWLKSPMESKNIPERMIAANCYAALRPSNSFWELFLGQVKKLEAQGRVTPTQLQYLRHDLKVRQELMNLTLGDEDAISESQIVQLLEKYEADITEPYRKRLSDAETREQDARANATEANTRADQIERQLESIHNRIRFLARAARIGVSILLVLLGVLLFAIAHNWVAPALLADLDPIVTRVLRIGVWLVDGLVLLHFFLPFHGWNPINRFAQHLERTLIRISCWVLGINFAKREKDSERD